MKFKLPTGYLFTTDCSKGQLETLSIGDYGKEHNIKADFLGHTNEINGVPNMVTKPIQEKWVITLSTQYGCSQKCTFCDVPKLKFRGNATADDLHLQLKSAIDMFPDVRYTDRLNIHLARMGEPILNRDVFLFTTNLADKRLFQAKYGLRVEVVHPVLSTSCPNQPLLEERLQAWVEIKNDIFNGQAGLQLSINSTDEAERDGMFGGMQIRLDSLAAICERLPEPLGRKYCLNFAYSDGNTVDPEVLDKLFDKDKFMVKITPIHNNRACRENEFKTDGGYSSYDSYREIERKLVTAGWDVIVFIPSMDEEDGLVTCGNLLLSGSEVKNGVVEAVL